MKKLFLLVASVLLSATLFAGDKADNVAHPSKTQQLVLDVDGVVCSFCSYGLQKKLKGMSYVDGSFYKDGVHVDIEKQQVTLALKHGVDVDIEAAFAAIRDGGYRPIAATRYSPDGTATRTEASSEDDA